MSSKTKKSDGLIAKLEKDGHIAKVSGKDFVLFGGLLSLSHENGLTGIDTELVSHNEGQRSAVVKAVVTGSRRTFTGHGDASPANLSKMILPSYLRMAETRAICRALRWYLGIGMTAKDELPSGSSSEHDGLAEHTVSAPKSMGVGGGEAGPTEGQKKFLYILAEQKDMTPDQFGDAIAALYKKEIKDMPVGEVSKMIDWVKGADLHAELRKRGL